MFWLERSILEKDLELVLKIKGYVNKIPGANIFKEKQTQCMILNQLFDLFPKEFNFHPMSFCLPRDLDSLKEEIKSNKNQLKIAKPSEGGGGGGIFVFKTLRDLTGTVCESESVVQNYISNPLLINNKKWDMRIYVLIHGVSPMKAYLASEGLARFWTENYDISDTKNIYSHLTNYSLNKNSDNYINGSDPEEINTKISLELVWELIQKQCPDIDIETDWKQKIKDIVANVLSSMRSTIELRFLEMTKMKTIKHNKKFFQILGFDIMFDEDFNAWLFEVNSNPSMSITHSEWTDAGLKNINRESWEVDEKVKSTVFTEAAKVLISKKESDIFELVYDSSEDSGLGEIYEGVLKIYKKLSGIRLSSSLTISKFSKLANYLPKELKIRKVDLECMFKKLEYDESSDIGLITFFTALKIIAEKNDQDLENLVETILSNIQAQSIM